MHDVGRLAWQSKEVELRIFVFTASPVSRPCTWLLRILVNRIISCHLHSRPVTQQSLGSVVTLPAQLALLQPKDARLVQIFDLCTCVHPLSHRRLVLQSSKEIDYELDGEKANDRSIYI